MAKICAFVKCKRFIIDIRMEKKVLICYLICVSTESIFLGWGNRVKERLIALLSKMIQASSKEFTDSRFI